MSEFHVHQSLPICIALASLGGTLEVAATAVTALPSVREQQGYLVSTRMRWMAVILNVFLQMAGGLFSALLATWFGPISIVVPFYYCATLLTNMIVFGVLLGVETFKKPMRVGTHVIVLAVILLPVVGPTITSDQTVAVLTQHWYSILWNLLLFLTTLITGGILIWHASPTNTDPETNRFLKEYTPMQRTIVLLLCRAATMSVDLTVSRCLVLSPPSKIVVGALIGTKLWSGNLCTYAIVVQSYSVEQGRYVPLNATMVILVNALTGLLVWEDQPQSWYGYFCVFWLLGIGCDLLLSVPTLLTPENLEFGTNKSANILIAEGRRKLTGDKEEYKKLVMDYNNNHHSEGSLWNENHSNADTPKRKGYQSIINGTPPPSGDLEGIEREQQQEHPIEDGDLDIISRRLHYAATHYDDDGGETDDGLAWEYGKKNPMSPLTPTFPAVEATDSSDFCNLAPASPGGSHSTMSSREAWSEVLFHPSKTQKRLRASRSQWGSDDHHHQDSGAYYFDTRMVRQPPGTSSPPPPSNIPRMEPSIPTIPSGVQLVLEAPLSSSLTSNEHGSIEARPEGNKTAPPSSLLVGSDGDTASC